MADAKKKKSEPKKKSSTAIAKAPLSAEVAAVESGNLRSPWIPLVWILLPLVACVLYGVLTRNQGH